jgi:hypothetical protein
MAGCVARHLQRCRSDDLAGDGLLAPLRAGFVFAVVAALSAPLGATEYRSRDVTREFQREHPCLPRARSNAR